jgi:hypothetical protein
VHVGFKYKFFFFNVKVFSVVNVVLSNQVDHFVIYNMFFYTIVDDDDNVVVVKGGTSEHCVTSMLLNINLSIEVIPIEKEKRRVNKCEINQVFQNNFNNKVFMGESCPWF